MLQLGKEPLQSEIYCNEAMASDCQAENNSKVYQELIHSHHSNRRNSDCIPICNDTNICNQSGKVKPINDFTDAIDNVKNCCAGVKTFVPLASSQAKCPKQDADYLKIVASDAEDNSVCGDSKPFTCHANCHDQHGDNYLQLIVDDDYLQLVADDDYLQRVAINLSATDRSNTPGPVLSAPRTTAQVMSCNASIADITDDPSAPTVYSEITDDPSASAVYCEITDNPSAPAVYSEITDDPSALAVYSEITDDPSTTAEYIEITDDPSAPTVYNEIDMPQIYNDVVAVSSTSISRKLPLEKKTAVVSLVIPILVLAAACVWLLLRAFLLPSNLAGKVAFCAIRHRPISDFSDGIIDFDEVNINEGLTLDRSRLSVRQRSYYWLAASAALGTQKQSSLLLQQQLSSTRAAAERALTQQYGFSVLNLHLNLGVSLIDIKLLDTDDTIYLTSEHISDVSSAKNETAASFLGFSINGIFDQLVARKYDIDSTMTQRMAAIDGESVHYTVSKVPSVSDEAKSKNTSFITLQVPVSGVYLMTTSIHCTTRYHANFTAAKVNSNNKKHSSVKCMSESNSSETRLVNSLATLELMIMTKDHDVLIQPNDYVASTSVLVNLTANNDQVVRIDISGSADVSLVRYAVQLVLYKPAYADNKVAWSAVYTSLTAVRPVRNTISVVINEGGAYDSVSNRVIVPVDGVYYLMLTVHVPATSPSRYRVMLNANTIALEDNRRQSAVFYAKDHGTTDKSIMLTLVTNDVLTHQFSDPPSFGILVYSSRFSGFLLYPK